MKPFYVIVCSLLLFAAERIPVSAQPNTPDSLLEELRLDETTPATDLVKIQSFVNPSTPPDPARFVIEQIVIKFHEGAQVRLRSSELVIDSNAAADTAPRLRRRGLTPADVERDLIALGAFLSEIRATVHMVSADVPENDLTRLRRRAEQQSGEEMPDLATFFFVMLPEAPSPPEAANALERLRSLPSVEVAYFQPIPEGAQDKPPPTTIDLRSKQGYVRSAPQGVDSDFARRFPGGTGSGIRLIDIEAGWYTGHEDLPQMRFSDGVNFWREAGDHGTASLGIVAARDNGYGITGMAPDAQFGWAGVTGFWPPRAYSVAAPLMASTRFLRSGDVALIEQHFPPDPFASPPPDLCGGNGQLGYIAVETIPLEFSAIANLTRAGIVVVEPAGNGGVRVVPANRLDSGAIVVGASGAGDRLPSCFTNYGPRVDVHAWGRGIATLGYGDLRANGDDVDQWYKLSFGGTSGATPIVAGAAVLIQSTRAAASLPKLTSTQMRELLQATGTPQAGPGVPPRTIGPQPNIKAAIATPDQMRLPAIFAILNNYLDD